MQTELPVEERGASAVKSANPATAGRGCRTAFQAVPPAAQVTVFICVNSARDGMVPPAGVRQRSVLPAVQWPFTVDEIVVPCAGKIQPEHVLKAFEAGAALVAVITCAEDNCHYIEGSPRASRRVEYLRSLLDEVGLGRERLLLFRLSGSAKEDMALGCGKGFQPLAHGQDAAAALEAIVAEISGKLKALGATPLSRDSQPA